MKKLIAIIDAISNVTGNFFAYLIYVLMGVVVYEVAARKLFNAPTSWVFDMTGYLGGAFFLPGFAFCMLKRGHVRIDVIEQKFSQKIRYILRIVTFFVFFLPFALGLFYAGWHYAGKAWEILELGQSAWKPPVYIPKTLIPVGFGLLLMQGVSNFLKDLIEMKEGRSHES